MPEHHRPEDVMRRLLTGEYRQLAVEAAAFTPQAHDIMEADLDLKCILTSMVEVGLLPFHPDMHRHMVCYISLALAVQKRMAEGRCITPDNFSVGFEGVGDAPVPPASTPIPDIFKDALNDVDTGGI